ncbi:MAG TPA: VOC family protein [Steroidobacteraceae bacterium]|nr:VOC family protein [Steroidobacteraceae bacterium]
MSRPAANPIPEGFHSLTPMLICKGALDAISFYQRAFGAVEVTKLVGPDGSLLHASLRIGDSILMLTEECPPMGARDPRALGGSPVSVHLAVRDADAAFKRAVEAGASAVMPVSEMFWGARYGVLSDPYGHTWSVATQVKDLSPAEIEAGMRQACAAAATSSAA